MYPIRCLVIDKHCAGSGSGILFTPKWWLYCSVYERGGILSKVRAFHSHRVVIALSGFGSSVRSRFGFSYCKLRLVVVRTMEVLIWFREIEQRIWDSSPSSTHQRNARLAQQQLAQVGVR